MSYSVSSQCGCCKKRSECVDEAFIYGAVSGIHNVNTYVDNRFVNRGHKGSGSIEIKCSNYDKITE